MKTNPMLLLLVGCSLTGFATEPAPPDGSSTYTWIEPDDAAAAAFRRIGEQVISRVGSLLIFEVERGIATQGLVRTMATVHLKDLELPKPEPGQPRVTVIKRTSLKLRSPANQPDAADLAALEKIDTALQEGDDVPKLLIQRIAPANTPEEWRVYRPITTMPLCLKCHGPREGLQPEIRAFLDLHYPADQATEYSAYAWRGVIRVSLAAPEPAKADVHH
jgi:hypothetical protein